MATIAQFLANQSNAHRSTGPTSETGKQKSSRNRTKHGLCHHNESFFLLTDENPDKFNELRAALQTEHQPQTETERILVQRLADHEWLRMRALRLQQTCIFEGQHVLATEQFALYMRYQTTHERAFYKALKELQTIRAQRIKEQIGFESQKREQAAEQRAAETHHLKKQELQLKIESLASLRPLQKMEIDLSNPATAPRRTPPTPNSSPGDLKICA